jgi:hypothetical protein
MTQPNSETIDAELVTRIEDHERRLQRRLEMTQNDAEREQIQRELDQLQLDRSALTSLDVEGKKRLYERYAPEA